MSYTPNDPSGSRLSRGEAVVGTIRHVSDWLDFLTGHNAGADSVPVYGQSPSLGDIQSSVFGRGEEPPAEQTVLGMKPGTAAILGVGALALVALK